MELRHLRYFIAIGEEQHYGRAARMLRVAQPALSRQIQDLEGELGFELFERLPRGVRLSLAGQLFLEDARRILLEISDAATRAGRVARGLSGTLRIGFTENSCWRGAVPESLRRFRELQPDAELQLQPSASAEQIEAIRSGRLDAGFVNFMPKSDPELDQLPVAIQRVELAAPKGHPLTTLKKLRLRNLTDAPFIWFPRWSSPAFYDRMMRECYRGGFEVSPHRSGGTERGNDPKSRIERLGRGLGPGNSPLAMSRNHYRVTRGRLEYASDFGPRVETGQRLSFARKVCWRRAAFARRASCQ